MPTQSKEAEMFHESKTFARNVVSSLFANIIFGVLVGSGLLYGYKRKWFDRFK